MVALALFSGSSAVSQEPSTPPVDGTQNQEPAKRLAEVDQQLVALRALLTVQNQSASPAADLERRALEREIDLLERLFRVLENRQKALESAHQITEEEGLLKEKSEDDPAESLGHGAPFKLADLDALLDRRDAMEARREILEQSLRDQQAFREDAETNLQLREREVREAQGSLKEAEAESATALRRELRLKNLELESAREQIATLDLEIANENRRLELLAQRERRLEELAAWIEPQLVLTDEQLEESLALLTEEALDLESELADQRVLVETLENRRSRVQPSTVPGEDLGMLAHDVLSAAGWHMEVLQGRLERIEDRKTALEIRYRFLRGELTERSRLETARATLKKVAEGFERQRRREESRLLESQASLVSIQNLLEEADVGREETWWLQKYRDELKGLLALYEEDLVLLGQAVAHIERPLKRIEARLDVVSFEDRLSQAKELSLGIWSYEILAVEGNSITVSKVLTAVLFLILGTWASRRLSRFFAGRVLRRFELDEGVVAALQTLTFYLLFLAFFLWALRLVNIPLTVFTFLGGAVAIGVGFGSQNIVNNFMSGLILMAERPVKVGDLVDLDGTSGRVEDIGARSTRIRSGDNTHIIVPNSTLLEGKVLNWTLSDNTIRTQVDVGVAYGSDVQEVKRQLTAALDGCERILEYPKPETLFLDFAADALLFRVLFWTRVVQPLDRNRAQSQLRFRIDERFREAKISIAFPQRDVHLDQPLKIRLLDQSTVAPAGTEPSDQR